MTEEKFLALFVYINPSINQKKTSESSKENGERYGGKRMGIILPHNPIPFTYIPSCYQSLANTDQTYTMFYALTRG